MIVNVLMHLSTCFSDYLSHHLSIGHCNLEANRDVNYVGPEGMVYVAVTDGPFPSTLMMVSSLNCVMNQLPTCPYQPHRYFIF